MNLHHYQGRSFLIAFGVIVGCVGVGLVAGLLVGLQPFLLCVGLVALAILLWFLSSFEQVVLGLLILRSSLDILSPYQIPAAFAVGLDGLTILYVTLQLLTGKKVHTDKFWWFFASWIAIQGLWVVLLPLGGLGLGASGLSESIREWVRIFSWLMVYLLIMQMKDRITPSRMINLLFLGLIAPLTVATMQVFLPESVLPPLLSAKVVNINGLDAVARVKGTIGHPNTFATFLLLFIGLTYWKQKHTEPQKRLPWIILLVALTFFLAQTKALVGLVMLMILIIVLFVPHLNPLKILTGVIVLGLVVGIFASTDYGQERLASIAGTPLLNPDIDISRAIILAKSDYNSFNWRLSQWYLMLQTWKNNPIMGYGLGLSMRASGATLLPHNDYIRTLVEGGIVGFATYVFFHIAQGLRLIQLFLQSPKNSKQQDLCLILLAVLVGICVGMITENVWTHTTFFFYWWTLFALTTWDWESQPRIIKG